MNFDFSIESSAEQINNPNTKQYFKEVYQTFINGNYRSSTVMLYSVLICDLVYKLRDLRDIYGDTTAKDILDDIEKIQLANSTSPEWESKLIEFIKIRTALLESSDIVAIESLQKNRHLSAHPILTNTDLLFSPNRDTVKSLIRNILEGILTNPPFFSNKIFDTMLADLVEVKNKIGDYERLEIYVKSRYLEKLNETSFRKLFRSLWKIVFVTEDTDSVTNRVLTFNVLKIFATSDRGICVDLINNEPTYYSNINKDEQVGRLIWLLSYFPDFYEPLQSALKLLITSLIGRNQNFQLIGWFIYPTVKAHLAVLDVSKFTDISSSAFMRLVKLSEQNDCLKEIIDIAIEYFGLSKSFGDSTSRFDNTIAKVTNHLNLDQTKRLLELSNSNDQIYHTFGMYSKLNSLAEKYTDTIDKSLYKSIFR